MTTRSKIVASNTKPNFSAAYSKANEILVKSRVISTFPFSPIDLVKEQSAIKCRTYKKARKYGIDITAFGSESATIFEYAAEKLGFVLLATISLLVIVLKDVIKHQFQHSFCFL